MIPNKFNHVLNKYKVVGQKQTSYIVKKERYNKYQNRLEKIYSNPIITEKNQYSKKKQSNIKALPPINFMKNNKVKTHKKLKVDVNAKILPEYYRYKHMSNIRKYETFIPSKLIYVPINNLPAGGWLQLCIFCENITSCIEKVYNYEIYCCNHCQKKYTMHQKYNEANFIYTRQK